MDNKELYNDFFNQVDMSETEVLSLVVWQYDEWNTFMTNKILELDTNFELYKNIATATGEIWDETTYSTVNALIARWLTEEFRWEFETNDIRTQVVADTLNSVLRQDYSDDDMLAVDLYWALFKYLMWVYIKICVWWNWKTKNWIFNFIDPRTWIPDPNGNYATWDFAFSWFNTLIWEYSVDKDWLNVDKLSNINSWVHSASMQKYRDQQLDWYTNIWSNPQNPYYDVYYHYFYIKDNKWNQRKALAILWNSRTLLLKLELFKDISNEIEYEFPFSFEYYGFEPNNPLGDNVVNHTAEPQKVKALMRNLRVKKSKAELYPMYFYNDKYLDKSKLAFWFNKFIPVTTKQDWAIDLNSIITAFRPDSRSDNSYQIDADMWNQVERATSIWANIQWSTIEWTDKKATEMNLIQTNSDINIAYREKISNMWKKQFVKVWYQAYLINFKDWDKKIVLMYDWVWTTPVELKKKDFLLSSYNQIRVRSTTQIEMQRRKEIQSLSQLVNLVASMETIDSYQKLLLLRDYAEALWYEKNKISSRLSWWPEEELIKLENEILANNIFYEISEKDNHLMHIMLQKPWKITNEAMEIHFQSHIKARIDMWKQANMVWNWTQQSIQASMAASNQASMNQNTPQNTPITT